LSLVTITATYKKAISKILWLVTNIHPELYHGKHIIGWIIGFSLRKLRYVYQRLATHGLPPKILHHLWSKLSLPKNPSPG
jgi:hypothetical protein